MDRLQPLRSLHCAMVHVRILSWRVVAPDYYFLYITHLGTDPGCNLKYEGGKSLILRNTLYIIRHFPANIVHFKGASFSFSVFVLFLCQMSHPIHVYRLTFRNFTVLLVLLPISRSTVARSSVTSFLILVGNSWPSVGELLANCQIKIWIKIG